MGLFLRWINWGNRWSLTRFECELEDLIWTLLLAGFFLFFFVAPSFSSILAMAMLLFALAKAFVRPKAVAPAEVAWLLVLCIPLWIFLISGFLHEWSPRHLDRPVHLLYGVFILLALRGCSLQTPLIVGAQAASLLMALPFAGYEKFVIGTERVSGPLSGNDFGNFAAPLAVAFVLITLSTERRYQRVLFGLAAVSGLLFTLWSGSRTAWLTVALVFLFLTILLGKGLRSPKAVWVALLLALAVLVPLNWGGISVRWELFAREVGAFMGSSLQGYRSTSMGIRLESIALGLQICTDHPLAGIGIPAFKELSQNLGQLGAISPEISKFFGLLHNQWLDACVMAGWGATVALGVFWGGFSWLIVILCRRERNLSRYPGPVAITCGAVTLAYFIGANGGSMFASAYGTVYLVVCLVLLMHAYLGQVKIENPL